MKRASRMMAMCSGVRAKTPTAPPVFPSAAAVAEGAVQHQRRQERRGSREFAESVDAKANQPRGPLWCPQSLPNGAWPERHEGLDAGWSLGDSCLRAIPCGEGSKTASGLVRKPRDSEVSEASTPESSSSKEGDDLLCLEANKVAPDGKLFVPRHRAHEVRQPGDGSCLFHALSYGMNDGSHARRMRRQILEHIIKNPTMEIAGMSLQEWVKLDCGRSIRRYVEKMAAGAEGGGIEIEVFTRLKGMSVNVFERCSGGYRRISYFDAGPKAKGEVNILYRKRRHYDALVIEASDLISV